MKMQKRNVLLLLDNCTAHVAAVGNLSNIKCVFFPPNTTSKLQPMDRGIIYSIKCKYRAQFLRKIILKLDSNETPSIDVLDAIYGLSYSWNNVSQETIQKCFANADLTAITVEHEETPPNHEDQGLIERFGVNFNEYVNVDDNVCKPHFLSYIIVWQTYVISLSMV